MLAVAVGTALGVVATGSGVASAEPVLSVSPATGLDPAGAFVVVSGHGFAPNAQLFVMQCRSTSTDDHTCNSVGLRKVTTDASGSFTANAMRLVSRFGATDCTVTTCSVMTSAVSGHSDDRSQDRAAAIQFAAPQPPPPATEPPTPPAVEEPVAPPVSEPPPGPEPTVDAGVSTTAATAPATSADAIDGPDDIGTATIGADRPDAGDAAGDEVATALDVPVGPADDDADGGSNTALVVGVATLAVAGAAGGALVAVRRRRGDTT